MRQVVSLLAAAGLCVVLALPAFAQQEFYPPGEAVLTVAKFVEDEDEAASFDFEVDCDQAGTATFTLGHEDTFTTTVPIGDVCTVTELGVDPLDVAFVVDPADAEVDRDEDAPSVTVQIDDAAGVTVNVFNAFDEVLSPGALEVAKALRLTGDLRAADFATTEFGFTVECATVLEDVTLRRGETARFDGIPVGTQCTITETDDRGAASTTITVTVGGEVVRTVEGRRVVFDITEAGALVQV